MKIFISYSTKDKRKMEFLERVFNKNAHYQPIIVSKVKQPGLPLSDKVKEAIDESDILIPILTRISIDTQWVNQEIGYATGKGKKIIPIIEQEVLKDLKGFINNQLDCPFTFIGNRKSVQKESYNFRKLVSELIKYLNEYIPHQELISNIQPERLNSGESYFTNIKFKGKVKNAFFDNFVQHLGSSWKTWDWDRATLKNSNPTTAGEMHGNQNIERIIEHKTTNWPSGKYRIYVRVYEHPIPGHTGRFVIAENIHELEVI